MKKVRNQTKNLLHVDLIKAMLLGLSLVVVHLLAGPFKLLRVDDLQ